jgi:hypothetical protein
MALKFAPFSVVGADRSGTTMLQLMGNEHTALHVPREPWFILGLMSKLPLESTLSEEEVRLAFDIISAHWRWKDWEIEAEHLWDRLVSLHKPFLSDLIDAVFRLSSERTGKYRWGDKTPGHVKEIDRLHTVFREAQFIHIIRDGRDICLSLIRYQFRKGNLSENAKYWAEAGSAGIGSGRKPPKSLYLEIAYEGVVINTGKTLRKVYRFLTVPYSPKTLECHKNVGKDGSHSEMGLHYTALRSPYSEEVHRWRREMGTFDLIAFEAIAGRTMDKVNQARKFTDAHHAVPMAFTVLNCMK